MSGDDLPSDLADERGPRWAVELKLSELLSVLGVAPAGPLARLKLVDGKLSGVKFDRPIQLTGAESR